MGLILAIDDLNIKRAVEVLGRVCNYIDGVKIGIPFLIKNNIKDLKNLKNLCKEKLWIADLKLADIGYTMIRSTNVVSDFFNAVIAHSFVGINGALDMLSKYCKEKGLKLILVATMSHGGAKELYDIALLNIRDFIEKLRPWGLVAPATRLETIRFLREIVGLKIKIISPGIGPQGALPGDALCAGSDYEIVGRLITHSRTPLDTVKELVMKQKERVCRCKMSCGGQGV